MMLFSRVIFHRNGVDREALVARETEREREKGKLNYAYRCVIDHTGTWHIFERNHQSRPHPYPVPSPSHQQGKMTAAAGSVTIRSVGLRIKLV